MRGANEPENVVVLDGGTLTLDQLVAIARRDATVAIAEAAVTRITDSRHVIDQLIRDGVAVYGVTTGFGALQDHVIAPDQLELLQENIILSHSAGVGAELPRDAVRAMMALRVNTFAKGFSGVRRELVESLVALINNDVIPVVPLQGSVGSSGDLAPLAHMASVLIGHGRAYYRGEKFSGAQALQAAGIAPLTWQNAQISPQG